MVDGGCWLMFDFYKAGFDWTMLFGFLVSYKMKMHFASIAWIFFVSKSCKWLLFCSHNWDDGSCRMKIGLGFESMLLLYYSFIIIIFLLLGYINLLTLKAWKRSLHYSTFFVNVWVCVSCKWLFWPYISLVCSN